VSGALGFRIGYVAFPTWHVAVQTAQVLAGLVTYPADNPFFIYHTSLWTLLHQVGALLLTAGVSEIQISLLLSGLLGAIGFQALAMVAYATSRSMLVAIGTAFLIFCSRAAEFGVVYPIWLMGTEHTYGSMGLSLSVLVLGLLASGCLRVGGFLLGVAPAVHPSLGLWLWLTVLLALVPSGRVRNALRPAVPFAAAGTAITALSLVVQMAFIYEVPQADPQVVRDYLSAFITFWDGHRRPVDPASPGVLLNGAALLVSLTWLVRRRNEITNGAAFLLTALVISAGLSFGFMLLSWLPPARLPLWLLTLMPARLLNVNAMMLGALVLGLLLAPPMRTPASLVALLTAAGLLAGRSSMWAAQARALPFDFAQGGRFDTLTVLLAASVAAIVVGLAASRQSAVPVAGVGISRGLLRPAANWAARIGVLAIAGYAAARTWDLSTRPALYDHTNDPMFAIASKETEGLLAADSSFHLAQLFTRRPLVLNAGALDTVSYAPASAPALDRLLQDVYGLDLRHPPPGIAPGQGRIPDDFNKRVWEGFSREQWREIRRAHHVTQVLTHASVDLDLPIAAQSRSSRLYLIPGE
jgi:hypothetical protein